MICRKCHEYFQAGDNYVRYGPRHTAHWNCFFKDDTPAEAAEKFSRLPKHQRERIPWQIAQRLGLKA